jgi:hypothetical protein
MADEWLCNVQDAVVGKRQDLCRLNVICATCFARRFETTSLILRTLRAMKIVFTLLENFPLPISRCLL